MSKNAELKNNLQEILADCTNALDEVSESIIAAMESAKDMIAFDALDFRVDAEDVVQTARGVAYHALNNLNEDDAAEVITLAAEICRAALDVQEFLDDSLDDTMEASDSLLEMAMDALDEVEEGEEDEEEEDSQAVFDALMELLEDMGLVGEGDTVTVRISPAGDEEDDDDDEDDSEGESVDDDLADAFAEVFDDLTNYFSSLGLMDEGDVLTISIEPAEKD